MILLLKDVRSVLGQNIKRIRKGLRLTQEEFSEKATIPLRTFQNIEMGTVWPDLKNLELIAQSIGIEAIELFREEVKPTPEEALKALENLVRANRYSNIFRKE